MEAPASGHALSNPHGCRGGLGEAPSPFSPKRNAPCPLRRLGLSGRGSVRVRRAPPRAGPAAGGRPSVRLPLRVLQALLLLLCPGLRPGRAPSVPPLPLRAHGASRGLLRGLTDLTPAARRAEGGAGHARSATDQPAPRNLNQAWQLPASPGRPSARLRVPNLLSPLRGEAGGSMSPVPL